MTFIEFATMHGVLIRDLYSSDRIQRCPTASKPRSLNGAYFWDGKRGWVTDWGKGSETIWYNDPNAKPWSDDEKREWAKKRQENNRKRDEGYLRKATEAEELISKCELKEHQYLAYKGFPEEKGLVFTDNGTEKLIVPMRNVRDNKIQGYQQIWWDPFAKKYEKKMQFGMKAREAVHFFGKKPNDYNWLVEGYATGISLMKALRSVGLTDTVVVCFSAYNLGAVATAVKGKNFVFADNDSSKTGQRVAEDTGLPWTMADHEGWDANDLHYHNGLFAVVSKIMSIRRV